MNGYYSNDYNPYSDNQYGIAGSDNQGNMNYSNQSYPYNGYNTTDNNVTNQSYYNNQYQNNYESNDNVQTNYTMPSEYAKDAQNPPINYIHQSQYPNSQLMPPSINSQPIPNETRNSYNDITNRMQNMGFGNQSQQYEQIDLMQTKYLFSDNFIEELSYVPETQFNNNCHPSIMQCTLNRIPVDNNLLSKSRLPLGVHVHPFRDMDDIYVSNGPIVRCKICRTYINPFVSFTDHSRRWFCNVCGKINDLPDEFMYDPVTKTYGAANKRPEVQFCSIEYIAQAEYSVRPPMAAIYVFLLDASQAAVESGSLAQACKIIHSNLDQIPGDRRTQIAFLTYNSSLQFYTINENSYKMFIWSDLSVEDSEVPISEDILVQLHDRKEIILEFLEKLPSIHTNNEFNNNNCLGFALQVATKMINQNGGRITIINTSLPNVGPGALERRYTDSSNNSNKLLQLATPFYKTLALTCADKQISVDLFALNRQYGDLASLSAISRHSSGSFQYYGNFKSPLTSETALSAVEQLDFDRFNKDFIRYLTRPIGFEAVMRTRFTKELEITGFHGNLFMRSPNVIALPVVNPDAGYTIQFKHTGSLNEWSYVAIQSALLYTTSTSERRIRVHTLYLPIAHKLPEVFSYVNAPAIAGLIAKLAIDRTITDGVQTVREAFFNSIVDPLKAYRQEVVPGSSRHACSLLCPTQLRLLPLYVLGLIRNPVFRQSTHPDIQTIMLENIRSLPLLDVLRTIYPMMISVNELISNIPLAVTANCDSTLDNFQRPSRLNLSNSNLSRDGAYLFDCGQCFYFFISSGVSAQFIQKTFSTSETSILQYLNKTKDYIFHDDVDLSSCNVLQRRLIQLCSEMAQDRFIGRSIIIVSQDSPLRQQLISYMIEDRLENAMSYYEFIKSIQTAVYS